MGKKKLTNHWWHGHTVNLDGDLEVFGLCPCFVRSNIQDACRLPHWFSSLRCEGQRLDLNGNVEQQLSGKEAKGIVAGMQRCMEREINAVNWKYLNSCGLTCIIDNTVWTYCIICTCVKNTSLTFYEQLTQFLGSLAPLLITDHSQQVCAATDRN